MGVAVSDDVRTHWEGCWATGGHEDCLRVARDAVDCDVPWTALAAAHGRDVAEHIATCPYPVHRWDCAWQLRLEAGNAERSLTSAHETHARSSYGHRRLMHRLDRLLQETKGRKTVSRDEVLTAWREALS